MKNTISKGWLSLLIVMGILILDQIIKIAVKRHSCKYPWLIFVV